MVNVVGQKRCDGRKKAVGTKALGTEAVGTKIAGPKAAGKNSVGTTRVKIRIRNTPVPVLPFAQWI